MSPAKGRLDVDEARARIHEIDATLIGLAAERVEVARAIGKAKLEEGKATVDFGQERKVLDHVRAQAKKHGFPEGIAEELATRLIAASVTAQEGDRLASAGTGKGATAVVVGGAGRMGGWFTRFLADSGYQVLVVDKALKAPENQAGSDALASAALVILAAPPLEVARLYHDWCASPPKGIVADVCSVKSPIVAALRALQKAGGKVASFHPLFGPSITVLRGADVVVCRTGDTEAEAAVKRLFSATTARVVEMDLDEHDRRMAEVLTLAHATALSFAAALGPDSSGLHSTTARKLEDVARGVVDESPEVYYEIQVGNPHSEAAIARLHAAISRLRRLVHARDREGFAKLMADGKANVLARAGGKA